MIPKLISKLIIILFLLIPNYSFSQCFSGAEISYEHIAGNDYKVSVVFYRNCVFLAPDSLYIKCSSLTNPNYNINLFGNRVPTGLNEATYNCSSMPTTCYGGNEHGVTACLYETSVVTLPPSPDWVFKFAQTCDCFHRDIHVSRYGYGVSATLNNQITTSNSSAKFINNAKAVMQKGYYQQSENSVIEQDGDSLVYSFTGTIDGLGVPHQYISPYSPTQFLDGYCMINPQNGDMKLKSNYDINSSYSILVNEYREINGVYELIGSITRSIDLLAYSANNFVPILSGMSTCLSCDFDTLSNTFNASIEEGVESHFRINILDSIVGGVWGNNCELSWDQGIQDASFQIYNNNTNSVYGILSWTPQAGVARSQPYSFNVTVQDDACPYNARNTYRYYLTVTPSTIGVNVHKLESKISVSPNPAKNIITIEQEGVLCNEFQIYSIDGQIVKAFRVSANNSSVDISELKSGMYIIRAVNTSFSQKIIKL